MNKEKAEKIAYAIRKKCQEWSLIEWCESWDITTDEFDEFLENAVNYADMQNS